MISFHDYRFSPSYESEKEKLITIIYKTKTNDINLSQVKMLLISRKHEKS